jgi:hypothetical protein
MNQVFFILEDVDVVGAAFFHLIRFRFPRYAL